MSLAMWQGRAIERSAILKIEQNKLLDSAQIVLSALGTAWFEEQRVLTERRQRNITDAHPLFRDMNSASDGAIVIVCELAQYLRTFMSDPAIGGILDDLRSDKYESTLFELAKATRWKTAGATVSLQPAVPGGKADFEAIVDGIRVIVEASTFPSDAFSQKSFKVGGVIEKAIKSVVNDRFPVAVKVRLKSLEGDFDGDLGRSIRDVCNSLIEELKKGNRTTVSRLLSFGQVSAELSTEETERITDTDGAPRPLLKSDWDMCGRICIRRKEPGEYKYLALRNPEEIELFRYFVKMPDTVEEPAIKIVKKLRKEARQLRGVSDPRMVILEVSALAKKGLSVKGTDLKNEIIQAMRNSSIAGVWLFSQVFPAYKRNLFMGTYIANPNSRYSLPDVFRKRLEQQEGKWDFVNECPM